VDEVDEARQPLRTAPPNGVELRGGVEARLIRLQQPQQAVALEVALAPLALPDLPEPIGRRLVEEHLCSERFWTAVAPPSVATDEPSFSLREHTLGLRRYWRGPTWVNSAWLVWLGLVRLSYEEQAATLARGIERAVLSSGLREFYDPNNGEGMGATGFAWSSLALELVDPDPSARSSHLAAE
jgi:glycogen debranching enzyme